MPAKSTQSRDVTNVKGNRALFQRTRYTHGPRYGNRGNGGGRPTRPTSRLPDKTSLFHSYTVTPNPPPDPGFIPIPGPTRHPPFWATCFSFQARFSRFWATFSRHFLKSGNGKIQIGDLTIWVHFFIFRTLLIRFNSNPITIRT